MKALTVRQPWAWAVIHAGKNVENRSQAWSYRGPLAIHAGLRDDEDGEHDEMIQEAFIRYDDSWLLSEQLETRGAIIGIVDLFDADACLSGSCSPWAFPGQVHLKLANPRPLSEPIPCRGRLGLWTPTTDVLQQLGEAL